MLRRMAPAAAFGGLILFALTAHLLAETKTVEKPMFNGHRLDWCANWDADCGEPAAEAWCIAQGFAGTANFVKAPKIGDKSPTRLIGTGAICDAAQCDGFKEITCVKLDPVQPDPSGETTAATSPAPTEEPVEAVGTTAAPEAEPPPLPAPEVPEIANAAPAPPSEPPPAPDTTTAADVSAAPPPEAVAELEPAVRVITPGESPAEAPPAELGGSVQPVAATAVVAEPEEPEEDPGPPPPDTITLAAAGAPPIRPVLEIFQAPTFEGRRLDWCRGWKDKCGKATADEFCKLHGFVQALSFAPDPKIGADQPTRQIASGLVCDHDGCDGFAEIACTK